MLYCSSFKYIISSNICLKIISFIFELRDINNHAIYFGKLKC